MSDAERTMDCWPTIERIGTTLGATDEMIRKWRVRGVPYRWRLPIVRAADAEGSWVDETIFDDPPGPKTKGEAA